MAEGKGTQLKFDETAAWLPDDPVEDSSRFNSTFESAARCKARKGLALFPDVTPTAVEYESGVGSDMPLIVDLDGTLLRTDTLLESLLLLLKRRPLAALRMPFWLMKGRACFKQEVSRHVELDAKALPVNQAIMSYVRSEKAKCRRVYLATAADRTVAQAIADAYGVFDGVLASDGRVNLKAERKAAALVERFPEGFAYAGNSLDDIPVWARADEVIVTGSGRIKRAVSTLRKPTTEFPGGGRLGGLVACARPHQWAKNILVFVPAILSGALESGHVLAATLLSFMALNLVASSTYILNDLWDVSDDRQHWSKRERPIASGALSISVALLAIPAGIVIGMLLGVAAGRGVVLTLAAYLICTLAYSFYVKRVPILDVAMLAGLFTLRLVLGIEAAGVFASPWLLVFSMFLFSSLCFAKRYVEVMGAAGRGQTALASRGYRAADSPLLLSLGVSTGISSIVILVLYIMFDAFQRTFYGNTVWLWQFPEILFLWVSRIWILAARGELNDDPVAFAVGDKVSYLLGLALCVAFLLAWSGAFA